MGKYDFDLELVGKNSLLVILEQIKMGSMVLEFGPANGRLTKYLNQELNCDMYLVEIDEEAGRQALQYAKELVVGDAENLEWFEQYRNLRFDYIVFADILEHLRDPLRVLTTAEQLLKEDGSVILSVPNLAHNSVIINLLKNEFPYDKVGLLDNTHIHFFTKNSLERMISQAGLYVVKKLATYKKVCDSEVCATCNDIDGISAEFWNQRQYGEIYQYVYEAKKNIEFAGETDNYLVESISGAKLEVFFGQSEKYTEEKAIKKPIPNYDKGINQFEILLPEKQTAARVDPMDCCGLVRVCKVLGMNGEEELPLSITNHNAEMCMDNLYCFENSDPQFTVSADRGRTFDFIRIELEYIALGDGKLTGRIAQLLAGAEKLGRESEKKDSSQRLQEKENACQIEVQTLNMELERQKAESLAELEKQKTESLAGLEKQKAESLAELEKQKAENLAELEKQKAEDLTELEKQKAEHLAALESLRKEHEQEIAALNKEWAYYKKEAILSKEDTEKLTEENRKQSLAIQALEEQIEASNQYVDNFKTLLTQKDALLNAIYHSKLWRLKNIFDRVLGKAKER